MQEIAGLVHDGSKDWQIIDARGAASFNYGHITGSINIPFKSYFDSETGCLKSEAELKKHFSSNGIDMGKNTVHICGSGNASCIGDLVWNTCGGKPAVMYDGGWSEYVST